MSKLNKLTQEEFSLLYNLYPTKCLARKLQVDLNPILRMARKYNLPPKKSGRPNPVFTFKDEVNPEIYKAEKIIQEFFKANKEADESRKEIAAKEKAITKIFLKKLKENSAIPMSLEIDDRTYLYNGHSDYPNVRRFSYRDESVHEDRKGFYRIKIPYEVLKGIDYRE